MTSLPAESFGIDLQGGQAISKPAHTIDIQDRYLPALDDRTTLVKRGVSIGVREYLPFLLSFAWFSLFLSQNLSVAHDSIYYLTAAIKGTDPWHANHLLTVPFMEWVLALARRLDLPENPHVLATLPNMLSGALTIQIVFLFLRRRLGMSYASSLLGAALPAVSFGTWYYSVAIEAYAVPMCLMFLCVYLLADEHRTRRTFVLVALIHSLAALFHQYAILMGPLILYAIYTTPGLRLARKHAVLASYTAITALIVGGTYVSVSLLQTNADTPAEFFYWLLGNATDESAAQYVGGLHWKSVAYAFIGLGRALIGAHFVFALPELDGLLSHEFSLNSLEDERFLVATLPPAVARLLLIATIIWFIGLLVCVARVARHWRLLSTCQPIIMVLLLLLPMTLVFTFYFSRNIDFWIVQSVCIWIVLSWMMYTLKAQRLLLALCAGLLLINLFGTMRFVRTTDYDFHQWRANNLVERLKEEDLIIIGDPWPTASFIEYLGGIAPVSLVEGYQASIAPRVMQKLIDNTLDDGGRVYLYDDVFNVGPKSALFYGPDYVDYVDQFRRTLPQTRTIGDEPRRQHRLIQP